jgi:hypothetical protein
VSTASRSFRATGVSGMQIEERIVDDVTILDLKGKMTLG